MKKAISCILIFMLLLPGCVPVDDGGTLQSHIAEEARVICENCPGLPSQSHLDGAALEGLLAYIRSLGALSPAVGALNSPDSRAATILLTMADGSQRLYQQLGNDYLRADRGPWLRIPKGRGVHLWQLLSDTAEKSDK